MCEAGGGESQSVLETLLPVLLTDGISSSVQEVRAISLDATVKVSVEAVGGVKFLRQSMEVKFNIKMLLISPD